MHLLTCTVSAVTLTLTCTCRDPRHAPSADNICNSPESLIVYKQFENNLEHFTGYHMTVNLWEHLFFFYHTSVLFVGQESCWHKVSTEDIQDLHYHVWLRGVQHVNCTLEKKEVHLGKQNLIYSLLLITFYRIPHVIKSINHLLSWNMKVIFHSQGSTSRL